MFERVLNIPLGFFEATNDRTETTSMDIVLVSLHPEFKQVFKGWSTVFSINFGKIQCVNPNYTEMGYEASRLTSLFFS